MIVSAGPLGVFVNVDAWILATWLGGIIACLALLVGLWQRNRRLERDLVLAFQRQVQEELTGPGGTAPSMVSGPSDVWVVWSDYGGNGANLHAVLSRDPGDDELRRILRDREDVGHGTGYSSTFVTRLRMDQWLAAADAPGVERSISIWLDGS